MCNNGPNVNQSFFKDNHSNNSSSSRHNIDPNNTTVNDKFHFNATDTKSTTKISDSYINGKIDAIIGNDIYSGSLREAAALEIKMAWRQLESQPGRSVIAGAGHKKPIGYINRIIAIYGGSKDEWVKMSSEHFDLRKRNLIFNGKNLQLHWYENIKTGQKIEHKPKIQD